MTTGLEHADIVVGIPSYNNAATIAHVVRAVDAGLHKYFPDKKAVIVNSDGGSGDGTPDVVRNTSLDHATIFLAHKVFPVHKMSIPYTGLPGKGSAIRAIMETALDMGVTACAVVDSDLRSITPEWIELLLSPVIKDDFDFVAPLYERHKFDGTITNSIVYPMTRALYGKSIRQPIGGEFGFSGKLAEFYLKQDVWQSDVARFGIDIWMTTEAVANNFKVCQSYLGAKIHDPKDPGSDLSSMLVQVVGSLFGLTEKHAQQWKMINGSVEVPTFGFRYQVGLEHVKVNVGRMLSIYREGVKDLRDIWVEIVGQGDYGRLKEMADMPDDSFRFSLSLWTSIIYDYCIAHYKRKLPEGQLIKSLTPLYLGKTASFVLEVVDKEQAEAEAEIEKLCLEYEKGKSRLIDNWS